MIIAIVDACWRSWNSIVWQIVGIGVIVVVVVVVVMVEALTVHATRIQMIRVRIERLIVYAKRRWYTVVLKLFPFNVLDTDVL